MTTLTSKKRQVIYILLGQGLLLIRCSFIPNLEARLSATPTLEMTSTATSTPLLPTTSLPIMLTPSLTPTVSSSLIPTVSASQGTFQIPVMPEAQLGNPFGQMLSEQGVSYTIVTPLESVRDFYRETLTTQGWEWLYTDMGQGMILGDLSPVLAQEFNQGEHRLAILALEVPFQDPAETPAVLVITDLDTSAGELLFSFLSLMSPVYNPIGSVKEDAIQPDTMQFTSKFLQFNHPSDWFPTRVQMITFPTDVGENNTNILQRRCANDHETCFINFMVMTGSVYPRQPPDLSTSD